MCLTIKELRQIIREEVSMRSQHNELNLDAYPWAADDIHVEIYADTGNDVWWAIVEDDKGKKIRASKPSQEEANFWARNEWEKVRRAKFGKQEKAK